MQPEPALSFRGIGHRFGATDVLAGISFDVPPGAFVSILGPSGCGKSTLVQMAAGLLRPSSGEVRQHGHALRHVNHDVGFVPQQAQLLPWKTLADNVAFPLVLRRTPAAERATRVAGAIAAVGLTGFERHYPYQLSGGMQKRASIARALVYRPDTMLMDEPFGALDAQTRMQLQRDLQTLVQAGGSTVLFVTHDVTEAVLLSDRVVVLSARPARVLADIAIGIERPRDIFEPYRVSGFAAAYDAVWRHVRHEMAKA